MLMTIKNRSKKCLVCDGVFNEKPRDSDLQWDRRSYCSMKCNNRSPERFTSIFLRLNKYVVKSDTGCWSWCGTKDGRGYGTISNRLGSGFSPEKAHRVSYELYVGEIPNGMVICHKCDNPECTNPDHLFAGTQKENMQDCSRKNRLSKKSLLNLRREKKLTNDQKDEIKKIVFVGKNGRGIGRTKISVANDYGVCVSTIVNILKGNQNG